MGLPAKPGGAHGYDWCALSGVAWAMMMGRVVVGSNFVLRPLRGAPAVAVRRGESSSKPTDVGRFARATCDPSPSRPRSSVQTTGNSGNPSDFRYSNVSS